MRLKRMDFTKRAIFSVLLWLPWFVQAAEPLPTANVGLQLEFGGRARDSALRLVFGRWVQVNGEAQSLNLAKIALYENRQFLPSLRAVDEFTQMDAMSRTEKIAMGVGLGVVAWVVAIDAIEDKIESELESGDQAADSNNQQQAPEGGSDLCALPTGALCRR